MKRFFKRFLYWITHKHPCNACCLFCKFYDVCKENADNYEENEDDTDSEADYEK